VAGNAMFGMEIFKYGKINFVSGNFHIQEIIGT
jgi:hypothetical protein